MKNSIAINTYQGEGLLNKAKDCLQLIKPSLSIMVVFSSVISYLLAPKVVSYDWKMITLLFIGGMLVTGSANAMNQVMEKDTDALMKRTGNRPIAAGRMTASEGWAFAIITGAIGLFILGNYFNWLCAGLSLLSLFLYAFIYTPLKKVSAISVLAGAVPGALPCLIGWAAGNDTLSAGGWSLFILQFVWQFPHFWAIAWIANKDYATAGFRLLPNESDPTKYTAIQAIIYSLLLIPVGAIPYFIQMSGITSLMIVSGANVYMVWRSIELYRKMNVQSARMVMFSSYIYLPVVFFAMLADKI